MPMGIADSPKPTAAMLDSVEPLLRSRISPLAGFASFQKKLNAECCSVSSSAAVVWAAAGNANASVTRSSTRMRFMRCLYSSEEESERETVCVLQAALIRPSVVHMVTERVERAPESDAGGESH